MAGKTRLPKVVLSAEQLSELQQLSQSRTASMREVQRARILCRYHAGETVTGIARAMEITRKSVRKWIDKALAMGADAALKDAYHRPHAPVITEQARAWVVHLACSKPKRNSAMPRSCGRGVSWRSMCGARRSGRDILR